MKLIFTLLLLFFSIRISFAQVVTETVSFDNYNSAADNDFANHFTNGIGLTQITTNGITGGCLTTPNTVNWGNDNAIYCSKYIASATNYANTSISFKYDSTQINSANFDRAASIFLHPSADFNHYVIASVNYNKRLQIVTYSWANNPPLLNLLHDHWYQFVLSTNFVMGSPIYQINISAQVNDLGVTGLTPPIPVGSSNGTINDSLLFGDSAVQVSITGALWGGAKYLENFRFEGIKSADSCIAIPTIIEENVFNSDVIIFPNPATKYLYISNLQLFEKSVIAIYNSYGQLVLKEHCSSGSRAQFKIDISNFSSGFYFLRVESSRKPVSRTVVVQR